MTNTQLSELPVTGKTGQGEPAQADAVMAKVPFKWDICPGQKRVAFTGHYIHQFTETWVMNYTFCDNPFFLNGP